MSATVCIRLQNSLQFFDSVLGSLEGQSTQDFDVLVLAREENAGIVAQAERLLRTSSLQARLVWVIGDSHDEGAMIHTALRNSKKELLIFTDSDSLLHPCFVEEHIAHACEGVVCTTGRVELSPFLSAEFSQSPDAVAHLLDSYGKVLIDGVFGSSTHVLRGLYIRWSLWRKIVATFKGKFVHASNFSVTRETAERILAINDVGVLLGDRTWQAKHQEISIRSLACIAVQYHLQERHQPFIALRLALMDTVRAMGRAIPNYGLKPSPALRELDEVIIARQRKM